MAGKLSAEERQIFVEAYRYFEKHCTPPANQGEGAVDWWTSAMEEAATLDNYWKDYPLMRGLLFAITDYLEIKAKERTKEMNDFV